jgi:hypothetical protein
MGTHIHSPIPEGAMKTTVEISDPLMREARKLAKREGVTFRNLVERSLQRALAEAKDQKPFKLRSLSFKGNGLRPELKGASWEKIRALIYEGHGG